MARVVSLECDKCRAIMTNDLDRVSIWRRKMKFERYDVHPLACEDDEVYLCGKCAKAFRKWLKEE